MISREGATFFFFLDDLSLKSGTTSPRTPQNRTGKIGNNSFSAYKHFLNSNPFEGSSTFFCTGASSLDLTLAKTA